MNETFNHYFRLRKISDVHKQLTLKSPKRLQAVREECGDLSESVKGVRCSLYFPEGRQRAELPTDGDSSLELVHRLMVMKPSEDEVRVTELLPESPRQVSHNVGQPIDTKPSRNIFKTFSNKPKYLAPINTRTANRNLEPLLNFSRVISTNHSCERTPRESNFFSKAPRFPEPRFPEFSMEELPQKRTNERRRFEVMQSKDSYLLGLPGSGKSEENHHYKAVSISNFSIEEIVSQKRKEKLR